MSDTEDLRDSLPDDLNASEYVGPYQFPDNSRRRRPAYLYFAIAAVCLLLWLLASRPRPGAGQPGAWCGRQSCSAAVGVLSLTSGWRMHVDEKQALVAAQGAVGFPVGHASAQQVWRGLRSRPTWRVLVYSAESPPRQRSLVLVDAVDGTVVEHLTEDNPEDDWRSTTNRRRLRRRRPSPATDGRCRALRCAAMSASPRPNVGGNRFDRVGDRLWVGFGVHQPRRNADLLVELGGDAGGHVLAERRRAPREVAGGWTER